MLFKTLNKLTLTALVSSLLLMSCGSGEEDSKTDLNTQVSNITGWKINDPDYGGFYANVNYKGQETPPGMVLIEGGTFTMGSVVDGFMSDWNDSPRKLHVRSFYIDESEITNRNYREYMHWLKRVFPPSEEKFKHIYETAKPDNLVWLDELSNTSNLSDYYFRHPSYDNYPVVGVNWVQANNFCRWRTDRVNEAILMREGILNNINLTSVVEENIVYGSNHFTTSTYLEDPSKVFNDNSAEAFNKGLPSYVEGDDEDEFEGRHVTLEDGLLMPNYRLPTEAEWEYAAKAEPKRRIFNTVEGKNIYPWSGRTGHTPDKESYAQQIRFMANFKQRKGDYSGLAEWTSDGADITMEVKSYMPNDFGIYDMAGNVSEWTSDTYRPYVDDSGSDMAYFRGNVFKKSKKTEDGLETKIVTPEEVDYDTLPDGRLIPRRLPGEVAVQKLGVDDAYMKMNFKKADNRNFDDGDNSSRPATLSGSMYNAPKNKVSIDEEGFVTRSYDKTSRTTLISDETKVYKGGSWKDRLIWLDPGRRRYLDKSLSTNDIGFRCAMERVGSMRVNSTEEASRQNFTD